MTTVIAQPRDLLGKEGLDLGTTDWLTIDQSRIDLFADATGDHQWIHVDPVRAKALTEQDRVHTYAGFHIADVPA